MYLLTRIDKTCETDSLCKSKHLEDIKEYEDRNKLSWPRKQKQLIIKEKNLTSFLACSFISAAISEPK